MTESVNLYKRCRVGIQVPNSEGNGAYPLYKRVDTLGVADNSGDNLDWLESANKDPEWAEKVNVTYGSPRNIKRLFIGVNRIVVHLWQPIIKNNKQEASLILDKSFRVKLSLSNELFQNGEDSNVKLTGKAGLYAIKDWALTNLEEVYFDWTALYNSKDIDALKFILESYSDEAMITSDDDELRQLFINYACRTGDMNKDYPRLKKVAFIAHLDDFLDNTAFTGSGSDTLDDMKFNWLDSWLEDADMVESSIRTFNGVNYNKLNDSFASSPGIYAYDNEILVEYFRSLMRKISNASRTSTASSTSSSSDGTPEEIERGSNKQKGDFEFLLDMFRDTLLKRGVSENRVVGKITNMFTLMYDANGHDEMLKTLSEFTEEGIKYYEKCLSGIVNN